MTDAAAIRRKVRDLDKLIEDLDPDDVFICTETGEMPLDLPDDFVDVVTVAVVELRAWRDHWHDLLKAAEKGPTA